jgi:RND family efflux transporter MFP subunit
MPAEAQARIEHAIVDEGMLPLASTGDAARLVRKLPKWIRPVGLTVLLVAGGTAAYGIASRQSAEASLTETTDEIAIPSVNVSLPRTGGAGQRLVLPGDVEAYHEALIYARVSGYLSSWTKDIGAHVTAGETIATIDTPDLDQELVQARADLATARANSALADLTYKRWHALLASNSVSVQSVDEKGGNANAERAVVNAQQAHVDRLEALERFKRLTAPFDGVITARSTDIGALINAGSSAARPLFKVADMHTMRVYVRVPQSYASELAVGMRATLTEPQYPGMSFPATLVTTSQSVASGSRTVMAELRAANPDGKLWDGTYASVTFDLPFRSDVLRVPASALIFRSKGPQIAVADRHGRITLKDVTVGQNTGTSIEILSGVGPSDRVVTSPFDTIENGQQVEVADAGSEGLQRQVRN